MNIKEILETNPVLLVQGATAFVAVCGALGVKELLKLAIERWWKKEDEKDTDHKKLEEIVTKLDNIEQRLNDIEANNREGLDNDILILEHNILWLQRKAIQFEKVSKGCMPRYRMLYKRYKMLTDKSSFNANEEAETNNEIVEKMFRDGQVVDSFWEMYK